VERVSHDRSLAEPAFPGDDGEVHPALAEVLHDRLGTLGALGPARVFVPIIALLGDNAAPGPGGGAGPRAARGTDKDAEMAAVLITGADGRRALLAFRSVATMTRWNPDARPVPVYGQAAAISAIAEGASALLLDLGSPEMVVVETEDLQHLAAGDRLVQTAAGTAWVTGSD
jgi:hypothetical protein